MVVLHGPAAAATAAVWLCPECGHGSPDPRDERAHLDAHRQLRAFFQEWDAGKAMEPVAPLRPARRRSSLYAAGAMAVLLVVSVTVFSRVNRSTEAFRARVPPAAAPSGGQPAPAPPAVTDVRPTPAPPAASVAPSSTVRPPAVAAVSSPPTTAAVPLVPADGGAPAPTTSAPPADPTVLDVPPAVPPVPPHLVAVCVLGICLTVL